MVVLVTSNAGLAMALDDLDHSSHIAEMKELKDNMTRFRLSNFTFCVGVAI